MEKNKKNIEKEVEKYMKLPYAIELIPEEDGTYFVEVKELPGCMSAGDTPQEAIKMIHEAMEAWIESNIERGLKIPPPNITKEYSGKFLVRVPTYLHRRLAEQTKEEGISLNQFVVSLLSEKITVTKILARVDKLEKKIDTLQSIITINKKPSKEVKEETLVDTNWEEPYGKKAKQKNSYLQ